MFDKVLIANRGEIALRVLRACRELGVRTVVVHSSADADSLPVRLADEAVRIGPAASRRSYLNAAAIVEAARQTGAQAVHPGYGFLSEDADFAEICAENGLVFVGPPPQVMAALADKSTARALMSAAGLPLPPGSVRTLPTVAEAQEVAADVGYPVIVKAAAGGGGRGMTVVRSAAELPRAYARTRAAAQVAFGDDRVYVERYLADARHVEVQVLCDGQGNGVHLGTRDCSVQRRHQKLIEEAPAPALRQATLDTVAEVALRGALSVGFTGAGTVEFLVDEAERCHFLEINCRIQVEHPVTEMVTGVDLVQEQLHIAYGTPLRLRQSDVRLTGVAIECRVNVEDPDRDFAPAPGRLDRFRPPGGPFTRVDTHGHTGYLVSPHYDSLLAKVAVWAPDRDAALDRLDRALAEFDVAGPGVRTTIPFARRVLRDPAFRAARHTTALVERLLTPPAVATDGPVGSADSAPAGERADGAHAGAVVPRLRSAVPDPRAEADPAGRTPVRAVPAAGPTTWRNR
ncbi:MULTISPECIES: acetyl/propionyl/methylcrotonyl-CoA carboxylase subunit alpha [Micromonospora]|uniref:acetyl-CoA carboxylase biotin carboxylase subunit n=1 Tax=Micromonospora TaxID=1873 RepID=UPI0007DB2DC7|nr:MULTISPECIES: acetyl-CoA carboxylase biotin carboxylase subunit [unclassified Micromonospora]MCK1808842.1 acetyl-CoA carboxylase biotin carboxylase subunit [Micromonospora sp. R42106]MCK1834108.1 acetyl-CoA carboxylase biotin carboxylase subunit [Micromonospora sp. R42003]MCK1846013.1 acetyl-CoA carboxylase biotin carboxylase subunit [Micromonospora sp. R42004]MCM1019233.1 acetyl-CoA carboxylase biotin carboxylase subunit [Micromonospora sp. XM-20-01]